MQEHEAGKADKMLRDLLNTIADQSFQPFAYYDGRLDCIRVQIRDCSVAERRIDSTITLLKDNYPEQSQSVYVGYNIKGVRCLFKQLNLPRNGVIKIVELLDKIVKQYPDKAVNSFVDEVLWKVLRETELEVKYDLKRGPEHNPTPDAVSA